MLYGYEQFFSPNFKVNRMLEEVLPELHPNKLCKAFNDRINKYYLQPAKNLQAFAQGVLCFSLIDFLADIIITDIDQVMRYRRFCYEFFSNSVNKSKNVGMGERIVVFLVEELKILDYRNAYSFVKYVRNGLIHEGKVKCGCYLSNETETVVQEKEGVLTFNPSIVIRNLDLWLKKYYKQIQEGKETCLRLHEYIKKFIKEDLEAIEKRKKGDIFPCNKRIE